MDNIDKVVDYINVQRDRYVDELNNTSPFRASARFRSINPTCAGQPSGAPIT